MSKIRNLIAAERELRRLRRPGAIDPKVDRAFTSPIIPPSQVRAELATLARLVSENRWSRVVEIGRANGGSLYVLANASARGATIVSVDLAVTGRAGHRLLTKMAPGRTIHLLYGDSTDEATVQSARLLLGGLADFLFIDGDHSYGGVSRDYELWSTIVRPGGMVGFHDINPGPESGGVPTFWREIGGGREITLGDGPGYGIGLRVVE